MHYTFKFIKNKTAMLCHVKVLPCFHHTHTLARNQEKIILANHSEFKEI